MGSQKHLSPGARPENVRFAFGDNLADTCPQLWVGSWGADSSRARPAGEKPVSHRLPGCLAHQSGNIPQSGLAKFFLTLFYQVCFGLRDTGERTLYLLIGKRGHWRYWELRRHVIT